MNDEPRVEAYALLIKWEGEEGEEESYRIMRWHDGRGAYYIIATCDSLDDAEEIIGALLMVDEERRQRCKMEMEALKAELRGDDEE